MLKLKDLDTVLELHETRWFYIYKKHIDGPPQYFCKLLTAFYNEIDIQALADIISESEPGKTPNEILESRILFMHEATFAPDEIYGLSIVVYVDSKEVYE